jgi:hypothetical protein
VILSGTVKPPPNWLWETIAVTSNVDSAKRMEIGIRSVFNR